MIQTTNRICPGCRRPTVQCVCAGAARVSPPVVRVGRQTQGRGGKGVSVITGLTLPAAQLEALCTELKRRCGAAGRVSDGVIEIHGEHRDTLIEQLARHGIDAKRAGG
jgi:translation initiation factor 1